MTETFRLTMKSLDAVDMAMIPMHEGTANNVDEVISWCEEHMKDMPGSITKIEYKGTVVRTARMPCTDEKVLWESERETVEDALFDDDSYGNDDPELIEDAIDFLQFNCTEICDDEDINEDNYSTMMDLGGEDEEITADSLEDYADE